MNHTLLRRTLAACLAVLGAGAAIAAADPILVLEARADAGTAYAVAIESRPLCVRFAVVVTDDAMAFGPASRCPACRTQELA